MAKNSSIALLLNLDGQLIDSVCFDYDIDEETVKSSLINYDGYDPNIIVRLAQ